MATTDRIQINGTDYMIQDSALTSAVENLKSVAPSLYYEDATLLSSGSDLDDYLMLSTSKWGNYRIANRSAMTNAPKGFSTGGRLFVMSTQQNTRNIQILIESNPNPKMWIRYYNGTSWQEWKQFGYASNGELLKCGWIVGALNYGYLREVTQASSSTRITSDFILVGQNTTIGSIDADYDVALCKYDLNRVYIQNIPTSGWTTDGSMNVLTEDCYIRIIMRKSNNATITASEIPTIVNKLYMCYYPPTETNSTSKDGIPSFYTEQLDSAIETIRGNMNACGKNGDTFAFITDLHWDPIVLYDNRNARRSPMLMKKIIDKTGIKKIFMGGDYFTGSGHKDYAGTGMEFAMEQLRDVFEKFNFPNTLLFPVMGNHDRNRYTPDAASTSSEAIGKYAWSYDAAYALITKQCEDYVTMCDDQNYYYDAEASKTRYIFLNTHDQSGSGDGHFPIDQRTWLNNLLYATPDYYKIVIVMHLYYAIDENNNNAPVIANQGTEVSNICDAFNADTTSTKTNTNTNVVVIISGHAHQDYVGSTTGGIPVVLTDCDAYRVTLSGITSERDTINEQCFDIMTLDYTANKLKCVRIGRGGSAANREINLYSAS